MSDHQILREAEFDRPGMKKYYMVQPCIALVCSIILIPVVPIVVIIVLLVIDKVIDRMSCTLTDRTLEIKRGLFNRVESTVPLEKVTDLQMYQGPVMRWFGLNGFKLETAGQSSGATGGALVNMLGIVEAQAFRAAVLEQRDKVVGSGGKRVVTDDSGEAIDEAKVLVEIRDAMLRIEQRLGDQSSDRNS